MFVLKTKSRILAFLLGFIIIFNISFARPQTVEAVVGVDDAVIIGLLFTAVTGAVFIGGNALSGGAGADAFVDWMKEHHSNMVAYVSEKSQNGYVKSDVYSFLIDKSFMIDFIKCVHEFLSTKGEFTSEGYTYTPSSGSDVDLSTFKSNLIDFVNTYYPNQFNTESIYNWVYINGTQRGAYPYVSFIRATGFKQANDDFIIFSCSSSEFLGAPPVYSSTGFKGSGSCVAGWRSGTSGSAGPWVFNGTYDFATAFDTFTVISNYHISSSVVEPETTVTPYTADGQVFASDPESYAEDAAAQATGTTVVHHTDGSTEVKEGVEVDVPVTSTGEGEYSPDLTRDTTITKPASDVYGDEGTLTDGAVSIDSKIVSMPGDIAAAISDTYGDGKVDFDDFKITKDITTTFPFSLPWDIYRVLHIFETDPKIPVIEFDFGQYYPFNQVPASSRDNLVFRLDLSEFSDLIAAEKFFVTIFYALGLIMATRSKLIRG